MDILIKQAVKIQAVAADKEDAIRQAGQLLVAAGYVKPGYVDGMLGREATMSTYLGNGVAIPHGQYDDLSLILGTGISVLQLSQGVEWEPGEMVQLVIGIAAQSDEHVGVLARLAEVIEDEENTAELIRTTDPMVIVESLNRPPEEEP